MPEHIIVQPSDATACGLYRLIWPGQACISKGKAVNIMSKPPQIKMDGHGNIIGVATLGSGTAYVVQRPASYQIPQLIEILHDHGIRVIVDMDDSLSKIHHLNAAYKEYDPRINHKRNWMHAARACEMADLVTVTTEALAEEYGSHGRVKIIPNHIPNKFLTIPRPENEVPIITWAGWTGTHPGDLNVTGGIINEIIVHDNAIFMAYGDLNIFRDLKIRNRPPNFHQGFSQIMDYPRDLSKADIGLVPLKMSPFNEGKSWLKVLEYAALGIVPVASPTPANRDFAELGGCILAEKPADWKREVRELVVDHDKRAELSKKVREVASDWVIEDNWNKWWEAWTEPVV